MPASARTIGLAWLLATSTCLGAGPPWSTDAPSTPDESFSGGQFCASRQGGLGKDAADALVGRGAIPKAGITGPFAAAQQSTVLPSTGSSQGSSVGAVAPPPPERATSLPLSPPAHPAGSRPPASPGLSSGITMLGSLAVVLGIFFLVAWCMRRSVPAGAMVLPGDVFEILGRAALAGRQQAYLLRCGKKLILVSVTPAGAETLTEITDPVEVDRLAGLCQQARPHSATAAFRQVFGQLARQQSTTTEFSSAATEGDRTSVTSDVSHTTDTWENRHV